MQSVDELKELCKLIRYDILASTTEAGSGHATSALSAVELGATLFFGGFFHQDLENPHDVSNDRFVLSKGHASPLLYSLYQAAGAITRDELLTLRRFDSKLEGHATPKFAFAEVATGSLGQGLSVGLGMALGMKLRKLASRVFVLMGDSEFSEGQIYEALQLTSHYKIGNLIGILDVNRLGQRGETMLGWDLQTYAKRVESFGWEAVVVEDGHNIEEIQKAYAKVKLKPTMIIAKTTKGKGVSFLENQDGWHGKPVPKEKLDEALGDIGEVNLNLIARIAKPAEIGGAARRDPDSAHPRFNRGSTGGRESRDRIYFSVSEEIATREAYGDTLVSLGQTDQNLVVLDGEVSNSTYAEKFARAFPDRYFEMYIAEQNMVSVALGLSKLGFSPFVSTFGAFFTRAFDQIRMSQYSNANVKFCGSHAGVHIGQDGPSQMALEDLAMFRSILNSVVLYPSDAVSTAQLVNQMNTFNGISYIRTTREKTPLIYNETEEFKIGGSKILHQSENDKAVVFAAGITVHEALKARESLKNEGISIAVVDLYSIKPVDEEIIRKFSHLPCIVVEDHYPTGGLCEAVSSVITNNQSSITKLVHLCVKKTPRSGKPAELLAYEEIDSNAITKAVKNLVKK